MGMHYSQTDSGLLLAEQATDEAAVRLALKQYDPDLRLVPQASDTHRTLLWKVMRYAGSDRPAELVCVWQSQHGEPYPLSMRILDQVKLQDKNTRSRYVDEDERNRLHREKQLAEQQRRREDLVDDMIPKHGRPVLPRSPGLVAARRRQRRRGENV